jgi:hypothetical protein
MANFHKYPGLERISGQTLTVQGESIVVGLWGYKDFNGQDLIVTNDGDDLAILPAGISGNSSLWKIAVKQSSRTHLSGVKDKIYAVTSGLQAWDSFQINFNFRAADAATLDVRCITPQLFGGAADNIWRGSKVPSIALITNPPLLADKPPPLLEFKRTAPAKPVDFAVFAGKYGAIERAFVLVVKPGTKPRNLLVVLPHPFAQGRGIAIYGGMGFFKDPLSIGLIRAVIDWFALERWGSQLLAARDDFALLIPVPAGVGHGGEIGPFVTAPHIGTQLIGRLMSLTEGRVGANIVGLCCFSGGIHNANLFAAVGGKGLNIRFACNQDPASGTPISASIPARKQYLSGYTTGGPRAGFIYLPESVSWKDEPRYAEKKAQLGAEYPHTWAIPNYTLYAALMSL